MFLEGLKFALGFVAGMSVLWVLCLLGIALVELFSYWQRKRRGRMYVAQARALQRVAPQIREHAVYCFRFRTDDWIRMRDKTKHLK